MFLFVKVAHWAESKVQTQRSNAVAELQPMCFSDENTTFPDKFILLWMSYFPSMLEFPSDAMQTSKDFGSMFSRMF